MRRRVAKRGSCRTFCRTRTWQMVRPNREAQHTGRRRGRHLRGMAISALGYGIAVGSSYMGGALVFESGIGIDQSGQPLRTPDWTPVLPVESLKNGKPIGRAHV